DAQLLRDLVGRPTVLEEAKDLALARRETGMGEGRGRVLDVLHLAEDADHVAAALERYGAQLGGEPLAVLRQQDAAIVRSLGRPEQVPGEDLAAAPPLLGGEDRGHLASPD